ncbi:hypothetical protein ATJ97_2680 [Georgenia soli]|uniref:Glycosyltransferase involved in cell wall biosynthesis n=1 Tax=Georgenia soli TaxID=638953 RepID=A0A2A9EPL9_9MICO|nr:glycosyltransferase [Georgenia soli]PFG40159.1 hypothetical protein ATJ97_2680 [Georgenia soli]
MNVAVRLGTIQLEDGRVGGHDAGATLVRRLLRLFPDAQVIGPERRAGDVDVVPLEEVDGSSTVVVNMDVIDSVAVWQTLARRCERPQVMNLVWWNPSRYTRTVDVAALALSCALFPTFCNSERTATEVRETVASWAVPRLAGRARIAWVNLGVRLDHVQPRQEPPVPVVLYPAIYVSDRKRPDLFLRVVERVAARTPVRVEGRLHESHLVTERAMALSRKEWAWFGPLTASRETYWESLARTTAFLATAEEESYGLEYVEALVAGAVGIFPDRPWVAGIVPEGYPFVYRTAEEAESMLLRAVTDPASCRAEMDRAAGGDFGAWLRARHDDDAFDQAVTARLREWFGVGASPVPAGS